jgi:hypothetical protein
VISVLDSRSLALLDADLVPDALLGIAVAPSTDTRRHGGLDVAIMRFRKWVRDDRAALFLWEECWIGTPRTLDDHLERFGSESERAVIIGHKLFDYAYPALERLGLDTRGLVERTVDVGFELAVKVEQANPYVSYYSGLGRTAEVNSDGRIGPEPTAAFEARFADVGDPWRLAMWEATVSCWLWTRMVAGGEIALPPAAEKHVRFGDDDLDVLLAKQPRFDSTLWGLQLMLHDEQHAA